MIALSCSSSGAVDLQEQEQTLSHLPPLESLLLHWHRCGNGVAAEQDVTALLCRREAALGPATLSATSLHLVCALAMESLSRLAMRESDSADAAWTYRPLHARIVRHAASLSAVETQRLLPPGVLVQKTVTLRIGDCIVLCTGIGTFTLTREHLFAVTDRLGLSRKAARHCHINPPDCQAIDYFGMQPGMVSPFLPPGRHTALAALVVLPVAEYLTGQQREVAISLSLWESLLLPLRCLPDILSEYAVRTYPEVPFLPVSLPLLPPKG